MKTRYINAVTYTGEGFTNAFSVEDGRFTALGQNSLNDDSEKTIDLKGKFVCAGFNDSHMHTLSYGNSLLTAKLNEHTSSLKEMLKYVSDFSKELRPGQWIIGRGWNQDYFEDVHRMPTKQDLDTITKDVPIMLTRACGHSCVVNDRLMEIAGIKKDTIPPAGGDIEYDKGLIYDNAMDLLEACMPLPDKQTLKDMILAAQRSLNSFGITSCHSDDYSMYRKIPFETINEAFQELEKEGKLTVRINEQSNFNDFDEFQRFVKAGNVTGKGSDMFRIGPLKLLGDGSLGSRTAHLSKPYNDDPSVMGFSLFTDEMFHKMISFANENGMPVAVHAIGDACLDKVLDAIEDALGEHPRQDHRHGIVHCQISRKDQLDRMIRLRTHIYAQSVFLDYDSNIVEDRVGKDMASTSYNWKTLMKAGLTVSNGSDAPVEIPDALKGIECAITRTSVNGDRPYLPDQAFTVKEALDSFTINSAKGSFEESYKGLIREGYLADFVVLDEDPFHADPRHIHEIRIDSTWLGGNCVYQNS